MQDIKVDKKWSEYEIEFYQQLIDNRESDKDELGFTIFMILPVSFWVPHVKSWESFWFEVVVLDLRYEGG